VRSPFRGYRRHSGHDRDDGVHSSGRPVPAYQQASDSLNGGVEKAGVKLSSSPPEVDEELVRQSVHPAPAAQSPTTTTSVISTPRSCDQAGSSAACGPSGNGRSRVAGSELHDHYRRRPLRNRFGLATTKRARATTGSAASFSIGEPPPWGGLAPAHYYGRPPGISRSRATTTSLLPTTNRLRLMRSYLTTRWERISTVTTTNGETLRRVLEEISRGTTSTRELVLHRARRPRLALFSRARITGSTTTPKTRTGTTPASTTTPWPSVEHSTNPRSARSHGPRPASARLETFHGDRVARFCHPPVNQPGVPPGRGAILGDVSWISLRRVRAATLITRTSRPSLSATSFSGVFSTSPASQAPPPVRPRATPARTTSGSGASGVALGGLGSETRPRPEDRGRVANAYLPVRIQPRRALAPGAGLDRHLPCRAFRAALAEALWLAARGRAVAAIVIAHCASCGTGVEATARGAPSARTVSGATAGGSRAPQAAANGYPSFRGTTSFSVPPTSSASPSMRKKGSALVGKQPPAAVRRIAPAPGSECSCSRAESLAMLALGCSCPFADGRNSADSLATRARGAPRACPSHQPLHPTQLVPLFQTAR